MLHFVYSTAYFPLTLTLSLREREQPASAWSLADGRWANSGTGVNERRWTVLPLPRGSRGERARGGGGQTECSHSHGPMSNAPTRRGKRGLRFILCMPRDLGPGVCLALARNLTLTLT